eukprot:gene7449-5247_t
MTSIKEAIKRFEEYEFKVRTAEAALRAKQTGGEPEPVEPVKASEEKKVLLIGIYPHIQKMDKDLAQLKECEHLGLSTNNIEKIGAGLKELKKLKILSLGRNCIRKLEQLDIPGLEQLWISYNKIDKLTGLDKLKNLRTLYMSNNLIASWSEIDRLANQCPELTDVVFKNNPFEAVPPPGLQNVKEEFSPFRIGLLQRLPKLIRINGQPVRGAEREEADRLR